MKSIKRIFKKEEVFWAAIPIITWKKEVKKVYGTWLYYETNKKNTNYYEISGIASWRNFFLPLIIVFEMKKRREIISKNDTRWNWKDLLDKIILKIQNESSFYYVHWNRIINHGKTWKLEKYVFW